MSAEGTGCQDAQWMEKMSKQREVWDVLEDIIHQGEQMRLEGSSEGKLRRGQECRPKITWAKDRSHFVQAGGKRG